MSGGQWIPQVVNHYVPGIQLVYSSLPMALLAGGRTGSLQAMDVCIYRFQNVVLRCPTPRLHCFLSSHWPSFRFLSFMTFLIPSIQFFFGLPRAFFSFGIHFNAPGNGCLYFFVSLRRRMIDISAPVTRALRELLYFWDVACHMIESHTMSCVIFGTLLAPTSLWFSCWSPPMLYTLPSGASSSWAILVTLSSRVDVVRASGWLLFLSTYSALFWKHCSISTSVSVTLQVIHRFSIIFNDAVPFTHQNRITLRVSIFDNVSSRHAICQLVCMAVWHASCTFSRLSDDS